MIEGVVRFIWAHRTIAAGVAALWNAAGIFIEPLILSPKFGFFLRGGVALMGTTLFAILFVVSLVFDCRTRRRAKAGATAAR